MRRSRPIDVMAPDAGPVPGGPGRAGGGGIPVPSTRAPRPTVQDAPAAEAGPTPPAAGPAGTDGRPAPAGRAAASGRTMGSEHAAIVTDRLRAAFADGTLAMWKGKVARSPILRAAGLADNWTVGRHPAIDRAFEEYDAIAARAGMDLDSGTVGDVRAVEGAVASGACLSADRRSVNIDAVGRATGIDPQRLSRPPLRRLIDAGTERAREAARGDGLLVEHAGAAYGAGAAYDFAPLVGPWPRDFAVGVAGAFDPSGRSKQRNHMVRRAILALLGWIGGSEAPDCRAVVDGSRTSSIPEEAWRSAFGLYRVQLGGKSDALRDAWFVQELLCDAKLVPALPRASVPVAGGRPGSKRPSLAEIGPAASEAGGKDAAYADFVDRLLEPSDGSTRGTDGGGARAFLETIRPDILGTGARTPSEIGAATLSIIDARLAAIADAAWDRVGRAMAALDLGRELLAEADLDVRSTLDAFAAASPGDRARSLGRSFPGGPRRTAADALLLHRATRFGPDRRTAAAVLRGLRDAGTELPWGEDGPDALLEPTLDATCSVLTLYLGSTGANVAVGLSLPVDCMRDSDVPGDVLVVGAKARAGNKPIIAHLGRASNTARALDWLVGAGRPMRSEAPPEGVQRLMVARWNGAPLALSEHRFGEWFDAFAASIPAFDGLVVRASSMRPSILLRAALENDGRLRAGIAMGQHGERVSQGYQQRWPVRAAYDAHIAGFQALLETLATGGRTDLLAGLGMDEPERRRRLRDLRSSGLGTLCAAPLPGAEPGAGCATLSCWDACPHMVVVAEPENVAMLQIWRDALRGARPEWERDRPERWERTWLPWLVLVDVVQERMSRGPLLQAWRAAEEFRARIEAEPGFVPPRPF